MEYDKVLDVLDRLQSCLEHNLMDIAKELLQLEIDNLQGVTERKCYATKYNPYSLYCRTCSNLNCNKNEGGEFLWDL